MRQQDRQLKRLRNAVLVLRGDSDPENFTMRKYMNYPCGAPACVLGHYASRHDIQHTFHLDQSGSLCAGGRKVCHNDPEVRTHFGLTSDEAIRLFGIHGCGNAQNPAEAADYIEGFIKGKVDGRLRSSAS